LPSSHAQRNNMRIKKHSNKNEYLLTPAGMWVRNYTKTLVPFVDINSLTREQEYSLLLENETVNNRSRHPWVDSEKFLHDKIVIVSDGHWFNVVEKVLGRLDKSVTIMAVNGALKKWKESRVPGYYVVNNPYPECLHFMPRVFPRCIASVRTNHQFLERYRGVKYRYLPVGDEKFSGTKGSEVEYQIDDYRNPICAAVCLAYHFGVQKLLLACCDDSFGEERPGAEALPNGLWQYPQQRVGHGFIDGCLYWLRQSGPEMSIRSSSACLEYENAPYIRPEEIVTFFEDKNG